MVKEGDELRGKTQSVLQAADKAPSAWVVAKQQQIQEAKLAGGHKVPFCSPTLLLMNLFQPFHSIFSGS